jgi:hypothetical protein
MGKKKLNYIFSVLDPRTALEWSLSPCPTLAIRWTAASSSPRYYSLFIL